LNVKKDEKDIAGINMPKKTYIVGGAVIRGLPNSLSHMEESMARHVGEWSLLKGREIQRENGGTQVESGGQKNVLLFSRCFLC
jgi:hypothetical protein